MDLHITFKNGNREVLTQVRMSTVYTRPSYEAVEQNAISNAEIVIHFSYPRPQINYVLHLIDNICTVDETEQGKL